MTKILQLWIVARRCNLTPVVNRGEWIQIHLESGPSTPKCHSIGNRPFNKCHLVWNFNNLKVSKKHTSKFQYVSGTIISRSSFQRNQFSRLRSPHSLPSKSKKATYTWLAGRTSQTSCCIYDEKYMRRWQGKKKGWDYQTLSATRN